MGLRSRQPNRLRSDARSAEHAWPFVARQLVRELVTRSELRQLEEKVSLVHDDGAEPLGRERLFEASDGTGLPRGDIFDPHAVDAR